jgi:uncharacterized protein
MEEALDKLTVPASNLGKTAKTPVKKISVLGSGVDLGDVPQWRPLPAEPTFRFDALLERLSSLHGGKLLLMLDEIQTFASHPNGSALLGSLRAGLTKHKTQVAAVFTGSSQVELTQMFNTTGAPMYQYAQSMDFPFLGEDYLIALSKHFSTVHPDKVLSIEALGMLFARIGHKPALLRDIVKTMSAEGIVDCDQGFDLFLKSPSQVAVWNALMAPLNPLERLVLGLVAKQLPPLGKASIAETSSILKEKVTISKIRTTLDNLRKARLLTKNTTANTIDDPLFLQYLKDQTLASLIPEWA